jgi:hypothetical protein
LTKTYRCAEVLSWTRNQLLVLHFWGVSFYPNPKGDEGYQCTLVSLKKQFM